MRAEHLFRLLYEAEPGHVGYARWLAATLSEMRSDSLVGGSRQQLDAENEASRILEKLLTLHPDNQVIQHDLATSLGSLNVFEPRIGQMQLEWGIDRLEEAVNVCQSLAATHPNVPAYLNTCAHTHFKLGVLLQRYADVLHRRGDPESKDQSVELKRQAVFAYRAAARQQSMLVPQHPDAVGYRVWQALFVHFQSQVQLQIGQVDEGRRTLSRVLRIWDRLALQYPELGITLFGLAEAELRLDELTLSELSFGDASGVQ